MEKLYVVEFNGLFGFIKPYSSFRDETTFSQQFLTKSHLIGMEFKVFTDEGYVVNGDVQHIKRHKLSHSGFCAQQETIQSPNIKFGTSGGRNCVVDGGIGIINRHVLIKPKLFIGLENKKNANILIENMVKLTRNEDLMIPKSEIIEMSYNEFDLIVGLESFEDKNGFLAGFNRFKNFGFKNFEPMLINVNYVIE